MEMDKIKQGEKLLGRITRINNILWSLKDQVPETINIISKPFTEDDIFTTAGFSITVPDEVKDIVIELIRDIYKKELETRMAELEAL
jgi:hypothetical protein